ncbi:hypothetical protein [Microcella sp.]|uniref:hypothetical protein n=1 Tax=Microcella sp. TaxID=1913979 RepID=UPI003918FF31
MAPAENLQATFEARELLLAMLGAGDPSMHERVLSVVRHAALAPVVNEAPASPDDEVLTVSFERVFTRSQVVEVLNELRRAGA